MFFEQTVWFSLWDKVWNSDNLSQAMLEVVLIGGSAGVDGLSTRQINENWTKEQERLQGELRQDHYHPQPARRVWLPKPGTKDQRPLGVPVVRDRVVQAVLSTKPGSLIRVFAIAVRRVTILASGIN